MRKEARYSTVPSDVRAMLEQLPNDVVDTIVRQLPNPTPHSVRIQHDLEGSSGRTPVALPPYITMHPGSFMIMPLHMFTTGLSKPAPVASPCRIVRIEWPSCAELRRAAPTCADGLSARLAATSQE